MLNFQDVQREVGQQHPNRWEELWYDLVVVDGQRGGIPVEAFHWDFRTSTPDDGRDLVSDQGTTRAGAIFLPNRPSVWSVKSGADGVKCATLRKELDEKKHQKLVDLVRAGHVYFYCLCRPASHNQRTALRNVADECCDTLGVDRESVRLLFDNHLCDGLKMYPAVLKRHCPHLGTMRGQTLEQWGRPQRHFNTKVAYVDIADRSKWIDRMVAHLGSTAEPPILHVAGLSGIGKTRLVYEACIALNAPGSVMYFESYPACMEMVQRLADDDRLSARIVIDEVSLDQHFDLINKLQGFGDRVRVISIGPAGKRDESRDTVAVLPPPETKSGVLAVLQNHAPSTVPADGLEYIAQQCGHDLRFALLMLEAVQRDPGLMVSPSNLVRALNDTKSLYTRVVKLFAGATGLDSGFQDRYPWLTLAAYVGVKPPRKAELEFIASRASVALVDLEKTIAQATACGLGDQPAHLFEAVPRGMATRLFADVLWPTIEPRFKELLAAAPDESFARSIMQRVEMCPDTVRKEVTSRIDSHFRCQLGSPSTAGLMDRGASRTLRAWAELSPEAGLTWLRRAIDDASLEDLRAFEGSVQFGWGTYGPRRDVVWLLEHLACFAEFFATCEAMLFRLAVAENEEIGNNATAIWTKKFRVLLSSTQIPYPERIAILIGRMNAATSDTIRLVMKGFVVAVTSPHSAMAPPPIIGGRLVPPEWRPVGVEIYHLFTKAIVDGLQELSGLPEDLQRVAREVVIAEMMIFYKKDTHAELVNFFARPLDADERLKLSTALEELRDRLQRDSDRRVVALAPAVSRWLEQVAPTDLAERARLVISRPPWSYDNREGTGHDAWKKPYGEIVRELRSNPDVLRTLTEWLGTADGSGQWSLGWMLATEGESAAFDEMIGDWLRAGKCLDVCGGFLAARRAAERALPLWAEQTLNSLVDTSPSLVAKMTILVDPSEAGFMRVRRSVERDRSAVTKALGRMFGNEWEAVLGPTGQAWVLDQLWPESELRDQAAGSAALDLFRMFRLNHKKDLLPNELRAAARRLVFDPPDLRRGRNPHMWKELALELAESEAVPVIRFAARVALDARMYESAGNGEAVAILTALTGEHDRAIIDSILETQAGMVDFMPLEVQAFQGLFAALDASTVAWAVDAKGLVAARMIGEFVPDPGIAADGTASLPAVTSWYLRKYGGDEECFREFCVGRWNGRITSGWAWQRQSEIDQLVKAYSNHPIEALRRWIAETKRDHETQVERDRITYEEDKRR